MKRIAIFLCLLSFSLLSPALPRMIFDVMRPADINVPKHIQKIGIVNAAKPSDERKNILEGVLTGEMPFQDKDGGKNAVNGLYKLLSNSPRYQAVLLYDVLPGTATGNRFSDPMPWDKVEEICKKNGLDGLIVLEMYDTDFITTSGRKVVESKDKEGRVIKKTVYTLNGVANIKLGLRFYDPVNKQIIDEVELKDAGQWSASGGTAAEAAIHLIDRQTAVNNISAQMGRSYAQRISPFWYTISREYFKKPRKINDFAVGVRMMQANDWKGAIAHYEKALNCGHKKTMKRAYYNLALVYEINGELEKAKDMAMKSYTLYKNKKGLSYSYALQKRINEASVLDNQM